MKKKLMGLLAILCLLLSCLALPVLAAESPVFYVDGLMDAETHQSLSGQRIHWWFSEKTDSYYLFLPSAADPGRLRVHFDQEECEINGYPVESGGYTGLLQPGVPLIVTLGGRDYSLQVMHTQDVPAMFVHTENNSLDKIHSDRDHQETAEMLLVDAQGGTVYDGALRQLKGRGNSTFNYPKKPYQIKLEDKTDLLGMGKARTWILLADYNDYSLLRNRVAFELGKAVGLPYTSEGRSVDLYIDGEYRGVYLLCEKVEIGDGRVDIASLEDANEELNDTPLTQYPVFGQRGYMENRQKGYQLPVDPVDITGGYLLELDYSQRYAQEASGFVTSAGQAVVVKEPEYASQNQVAYISTLYQSLENALQSKDGIDPATGKHYSRIIDMDSFVRKYLLEEVVKNYDANKSSQFFFKPEDAQSNLLYAGPAWDYDSSFGNYAPEHDARFASPTRLSVGTAASVSYYLYPSAYKHEDFYQAAVQTYFEAFEPAISVLLGEAADPAGKLLSIRDYAAQIEASAEMNRVRWPIVKSSRHPVDTGKSFAENVNYLENFLRQRAAFLRAEWGIAE